MEGFPGGLRGTPALEMQRWVSPGSAALGPWSQIRRGQQTLQRQRGGVHGPRPDRVPERAAGVRGRRRCYDHTRVFTRVWAGPPPRAKEWIHEHGLVKALGTPLGLTHPLSLRPGRSAAAQKPVTTRQPRALAGRRLLRNPARGLVPRAPAVPGPAPSGGPPGLAAADPTG